MLCLVFYFLACLEQALLIVFMNVLLTGSTGFLGSHLLEALVRQGHSVFCLVRNRSSFRWIRELPFQAVSLESKRFLSDLDNTPMDYVIHCAGATKARTFQEYYESNVLLTQKLAQYWARRGCLRRFVFISSQAVSGPSSSRTRPILESDSCHPISDYGRSKLWAEDVLGAFVPQIPIVILRPPTVYGPRDFQFYPLFLGLKYRLGLFPNRGANLCHLIYVQDLVQATLAALNFEGPSGSVFFVHDEVIYTWREIFDTAQEVCQVKDAFKLFLPNAVFRAFGFYNDFLAKLLNQSKFFNSQKIQEILTPCWTCSAAKIQKHLLWQPEYSLKLGFEATLSFYRKFLV